MLKHLAWGIWLHVRLLWPCLQPPNQTEMAINCSATCGCCLGTFHLMHPDRKALRGLFLKVLKPTLRWYWSRRQTVWDHWDPGHGKAIIFSQSLLQRVCDQITYRKENYQKVIDGHLVRLWQWPNWIVFCAEIEQSPAMEGNRVNLLKHKT